VGTENLGTLLPNMRTRSAVVFNISILLLYG